MKNMRLCATPFFVKVVIKPKLAFQHKRLNSRPVVNNVATVKDWICNHFVSPRITPAANDHQVHSFQDFQLIFKLLKSIWISLCSSQDWIYWINFGIFFRCSCFKDFTSLVNVRQTDKTSKWFILLSPRLISFLSNITKLWSTYWVTVLWRLFNYNFKPHQYRMPGKAWTHFVSRNQIYQNLQFNFVPFCGTLIIS